MGRCMSGVKKYIWTNSNVCAPPLDEDLEVLVESNAEGEEPFYAVIHLTVGEHDGRAAIITRFITPSYRGMESNFMSVSGPNRWYFNLWRRRHPSNSLDIADQTSISKIVVPDRASKDEILKVSKYLHDLPNINTDYSMVNFLCHLHLAPDLVVVEP